MSYTLNSTITFAEIQGNILKTSPHGNYVVVELSKRIIICGTYSNKFGWSENSEEQSGFTSFITYIGCKSQAEYAQMRSLVQQQDGSCEELREAKRNPHFPLEFKVRELTPDAVVALVQDIK